MANTEQDTAEHAPPMPRYRSSGFGSMTQSESGTWVRYDDVLATLDWLTRQAQPLDRAEGDQ